MLYFQSSGSVLTRAARERHTDGDDRHQTSESNLKHLTALVSASQPGGTPPPVGSSPGAPTGTSVQLSPSWILPAGRNQRARRGRAAQPRAALTARRVTAHQKVPSGGTERPLNRSARARLRRSTRPNSARWLFSLPPSSRQRLTCPPSGWRAVSFG